MQYTYKTLVGERYSQGRIQAEDEGINPPLPASLSIAGRLAFSHIQNVYVQKCLQNWLIGTQ